MAEETELNKRAFEAYCALGPGRTLKALAEHPSPNGTNWSVKSLEAWSPRFEWARRAREYDEQFREVLTNALVPASARDFDQDREESRARRLSRARAYHDLIGKWLDLHSSDEAIKRMSLHALVQLSYHAMEAERLDYGEATSRNESTTTQHVFKIIRETAPAPQVVAEVADTTTSAADIVAGEFVALPESIDAPESPGPATESGPDPIS